MTKDNTDKALVEQAGHNSAPGTAAQNLRKTECSGFNQQQFKAGEEMHRPVRFMLDPERPAGGDTVTLSYTFFDVTELAQRSSGKPKT